MSVLSVAFAGAIGIELYAGTGGDSGATPVASAARAPPTIPSSRTAPEDQTGDWAATILARPLFDPHRQPQAVAAGGSVGTMSGVPRLTGVVIGPAGKSAIFASDAAGKAVVVTEGSRIGQYIVQSIDVGETLLLGPDGPLALRPTFQNPLGQPASGVAKPRRPAPRG